MSERFIKGEEELAYKARFKEFSKVINPKPSEEERKRLIQERIEARGKKL
jgi:hypothetical protein